MKNRFNINESEKNRIRGLHGMQVITEQSSEKLISCAAQVLGEGTPEEEKILALSEDCKTFLNEQMSDIDSSSGLRVFPNESVLTSSMSCVGDWYGNDFEELIMNNWDDWATCITGVSGVEKDYTRG